MTLLHSAHAQRSAGAASASCSSSYQHALAARCPAGRVQATEPAWQRVGRRGRGAAPLHATGQGGPGEGAPSTQASTSSPNLGDPVGTLLWGGTLPSGRRAVLGGLSGLGIALGGNLGGCTSFLLGLDGGEAAGRLRADILIPVKGRKRCFDQAYGFGAFPWWAYACCVQQGHSVAIASPSTPAASSPAAPLPLPRCAEFTYPADWLGDQTIAYRAARRAEAARGGVPRADRDLFYLDAPPRRSAAAR
jgi:hypothetical protein